MIALILPRLNLIKTFIIDSSIVSYKLIINGVYECYDMSYLPHLSRAQIGRKDRVDLRQSRGIYMKVDLLDAPGQAYIHQHEDRDLHFQ